MGYIYLIEDIDNSTYKIGRTKLNPLRRLKQLQTGNSTKLELLSFYESKYPCRLENLLHNKFKIHNVEYVDNFKKNAKSEWYYLNRDQVSSFLKTCEFLENMIDAMKDNPYFSKNLK